MSAESLARLVDTEHSERELKEFAMRLLRVSATRDRPDLPVVKGTVLFLYLCNPTISSGSIRSRGREREFRTHST